MILLKRMLDLITHPNKQLSEKERDQVKRVARQMLNTLHAERLVLDWKKKESTRSGVSCIEIKPMTLS